MERRTARHGLGALLLTVCLAAPAYAEPDESRAAFNEGFAQYQTKHWAAALTAFERSYGLSASPNTGLLIARCHRELGKPVAAALIFQRTEDEARRRVGAGEAKYSQALEAATREGREVRDTLATIRVHVAHFHDETLTIDGQPVALDAGGNATSLHEEGAATIELRSASGTSRKQSLTLPRGATIETELAGEPPTAAIPPPPPSRWPGWTLPTAIGGGAVALAGLGVYVGFNAAARSTYDTLAARCGPSSCGAADRPLADEGRDQQSVAVVGLLVSAIAATVVGTILVIAATRDTPAPSMLKE
jgi:hypothetical protein